MDQEIIHPVYDQTFVGTFLGDPVWDIPYHILDRAKAVLGYENTKEEEE